ncbi:MAG TPA: polymer-forming cytoskeletal protein [Natrialbaceae archaeon]|nr:polymer-forming cytoskeletal protein [Natrialbaceae archaeon]
MVNLIELIPLLVVALLLLTAGGTSVERVDLVMDGQHDVSEVDDGLIVVGGDVTVPAGEQVDGPIYVMAGSLAVEGTVAEDVIAFGGPVRVADGGTVSGTLQVYAGSDVEVAEGATVESRTRIDLGGSQRSPLLDALFRAVQIGVVALVGALVVRRRPRLVENVTDSVLHHTVVSGTVGFLASLTLLALFVFMAFTLLLLPISLLGLLGGVLVVIYGYVVFGYLLGERVVARYGPVERTDLATAIGVVVLMLAFDGLSLIPLLGGLVQIGLLLVAIGAILLTYFGLREFEPPTLPE